MILEKGNILSNYRHLTIKNEYAEAIITGEIQTVESLVEFDGIYGFRLNEVPRIDIQGITSVKRNRDNQIFTWVSSETPITNQYGFDYNNPIPVLYFPPSENGESFTIAYKGTGGSYTPKNILSLYSLSGDINERLFNEIRNKPINVSLINQNIYTYNNVVTVNNLTITGQCTIRTNTPASIGILYVIGNLKLEHMAKLKLIRVILIVLGNIYVPVGNAEIIGQDGFNGGNAGNAIITGGGGGAGTGQKGFDGGAVVSNYSGIGGYCLIDQYTQTNTEHGASGILGNGGSGGGDTAHGGASQFGGGSGGGAAGGGGVYGNGGDRGATSFMHGLGGRGGDGSGVVFGQHGCGGGSGGSSICIIALGDISTKLTIRSGKNGLNGSGYVVNSIQPYSGNIVLYSRYGNGDIPCTLDVSPIGAGNAGSLYREKIGASSKMTGYIVNNLLSELASYGVVSYGIGQKGSSDL